MFYFSLLIKKIKESTFSSKKNNNKKKNATENEMDFFINLELNCLY